MVKYEYFRPLSLSHAVSVLNEVGNSAQVIAGGTDIIPLITTRNLSKNSIVDVKSIPELNAFFIDESENLHIGAATLVSNLISESDITFSFPAISQAASVLGSYQVRNRATIGGNICRSSPSGDLLPPLLIYNARAVIFSMDGYRRVPVNSFFSGPGENILKQNEILVEVILTKPAPGSRSGYSKYCPRMAMDLAVAGVAAAIIPNKNSKSELRLALGAVGPTPFRAVQTELAWQEKGPLDNEEVGILASDECHPIDDIRASAAYRRKIVSVLTSRLLENVTNEASDL